MSKPITKIASHGQPMHFSVGAVIKHGDKYLLVDRKKVPLGFAGLAGHVDEGEDADTAIVREVGEESGLKVISKKLLFEEEILWNYCSRAPSHRWKLYECEVEGEVHQNKAEEKSIGWYTAEELANMTLEPVWRHWFEKMGIITTKKKITLCGSMKFYDQKIEIKKKLEERGFVVEMAERFLSKQEDADVYKNLNDPIWETKRLAILSHFRKVLWADAILVVNYDKNNIVGYVGGNTLMEIGLALWYAKKIYFLNDIPVEVSYREELFGVKPIILSGDLNNVK